MTHNQLTQIIEQLAVDFVLIDHNDTSELSAITSLLNDACNWASDNSQNSLYAALTEIIDLSNQIINKSTDSPEKLMDIIGLTISEIQLHARNDYDFSNANFPDELEVLKKNNIPIINDHQNDSGQYNSEDSSLKEKSTSIQLPTGLRHPGNLPTHLENDLFAEFLELQPDILNKMEALILKIEQEDDENSITEFKRLIHTTKGEAGFLNLYDVETVCHEIEDIIETATPNWHADIFLASIDWIRKAFRWYSGNASSAPEPVGSIKKKIKQLETRSNSSEKSENENINFNSVFDEISDKINTIPPEMIISTEPVFLKFVSISNTLLESASLILPLFIKKPSSLNKALRLQEIVCKINSVSALLSLKEIEFLSNETYNLLVRMTLEKDLQKTYIAEIIFESFTKLTHLKNTIEKAITEKIPVQKDNELPKLLAIIRAAMHGIFMESDQGKKDNKKIPNPPSSEQEENVAIEINKFKGQESAKQKTSTPIKETINVNAERLDKIIDMVGELVIAESMIMQAEEIRNIESQELNRHLNQMDKITRGLQETGLSLRMLPIKSTFQKMGRIARDTAKKSGKNVKFIMSGEETELDKSVVDKIGDPLLHMVRNAIDHGIEENVYQRIDSGKPEQGTVFMKAFHKGGNIHIVIEDDGRGLNKESIIKKAVERNIIHKEMVLNDQEVFNLIFEQGFSTAQEITDLSGRGVGMNVVKKNIESLRGQIDIKSTEGKGSIFTIKIPLTLAIIDGMVVKVGKERFVIPTLSIVTSTKLINEEVSSIFNKGEMIEVQDQLIPLFHLSDLFKTKTSIHASDYSLLVVVEENRRKAALVVDELLGKQQIVIKTLGESMQNIPGISGGAIMPDGRVGLIIDVAGLVRLAHDKSPDKQDA